MNISEDLRVCPWWLAYVFDNRIRRLFHDPEKMLSPYVREGMTVADVGCGMGYFSMGMARLVGAGGLVVSTDLQQKMLDVLVMRAEKAGVADRIRTHRCGRNSIGLDGPFDFVLTFWMVHETPDVKGLLGQIFSMLKPGGKYLVAEPRIHVSETLFAETTGEAASLGFELLDNPQITLSRSVLLGKPG